jgi:hypothetical protein
VLCVLLVMEGEEAVIYLSLDEDSHKKTWDTVAY